MGQKEETDAKAVSLAMLDQMWAELRRYETAIDHIAKSRSRHLTREQRKLVRMMACTVKGELMAREAMDKSDADTNGHHPASDP